MQMWEYWNKGIPCHQFRKEKVSDIDLMIHIQNSMSRKTTSFSNQKAMLNDLMKKAKW